MTLDEFKKLNHIRRFILNLRSDNCSTGNYYNTITTMFTAFEEDFNKKYKGSKVIISTADGKDNVCKIMYYKISLGNIYFSTTKGFIRYYFKDTVQLV